MSQHYTIKAARNAGTRPSEHGTLVKWYVDFEEGPDGVYWQRKEGSDVWVGDRVYGRIESGQYGLRFYKEQDPQGGGGNASTGETTGSYGGNGTAAATQRPDDEFWAQKDRRLARAGMMQAVVGSNIVRPTEGDLTGYVEKVNAVTDALLESLNERAPSPNQSSSHNRSTSPPSTGTGAGQSNGSPPDRIPQAQVSEFVDTLKRLEVPKQDILSKLALLGVQNPPSITEGVAQIPVEKADDMARWLIAYEEHEAKKQEEIAF